MNNAGPTWMDMDSTPDPDKFTYDLLCRQFPLRPIRNHEENERAMRIADELLNRLSVLSNAERDYLEVVGDLIHKYESSVFADDDLDLPPHELIRAIIEGQGLKQLDLAKELKLAPSRLSEFLSGKRKASRNLARRLCDRFALTMETLFPDSEADNLNNEEVIEVQTFDNAGSIVASQLNSLLEELNSKLATIGSMQRIIERLDREVSDLSSLAKNIEDINDQFSSVNRNIEQLNLRVSALGSIPKITGLERKHSK